MHAAVTRIGRTVPTEFGGTVRAVWNRACAISLEGDSGLPPEAELVTLLREDLPMAPAAMTLHLAPGAEFSALGLAACDRVVCDGSTLVVSDAAGRNARVVADVCGAVYFDGSAPATSPPPGESLLAACRDAAERHWRASAGDDAFATRMRAACEDRLRRLSEGVAAGDDWAAGSAARSLIGLGAGLTPSGDDMLCGFLLARRTFASARGPADLAVECVAAAAAGLTTDVSAVQLSQAARGLFGEALIQVADALTCGEPLLAAAVERCLGMGSTSGADGVLGLVAGAAPGWLVGLPT